MESPRPSFMMRLSSLLGAGLVVFFVGAAIVGDDGIARHELLKAELTKVRTLNARLEAENTVLARQAHALRTDRAFVESVVRDELGWVRADEVVFIFD
ncbi:MAG: septum formation initiator family protein [Deltaproteobacteria bacterium]